MEKKKLGNSEILISRIGLGCMGMSEFYGKGDDSESVKVIHEAVELGINFLDTADIYGIGANEILVGKAIRDIRKKIVLATKFGNVRANDGSWLGVNGKPEYVKKCCDESLKRLNTDYIDLYYQHRIDPDTPIEETVGAMSELVKAGKVRYIGLSEASVGTIRRAFSIHPLSALQSEYSLWTRDPEVEHFDVCEELGITFVAYSPIGRGFLAGRFKNSSEIPEDDYRKHHPRFQEDNIRHNFQIVQGIEKIAEEKNCTPAQIAIAWVIAQKDFIVPIPGTKRLKYLLENIKALDVSLTESDIEKLNSVSPPGFTKGTRYPEAAMNALNR